VVAYVDDDAIPSDQWLSAVAREFENPLLGALAGEVVPRYPGEDVSSFACGERRLVDKSHPLWLEITAFGGLGVGCNMAFRRDALRAVGGFDEHLGLGATLPGGEEHDAFMRIVEAGYAAVSCPAADVLHDSRTHSPLQRAHSQFGIGAGYLLYLFCGRPQYRVRLARYAFEAALGKRRDWRPPTEMRLLTSREKLSAVLNAPWGKTLGLVVGRAFGRIERSTRTT